jgi:hypothetical protein
MPGRDIFATCAELQHLSIDCTAVLPDNVLNVMFDVLTFILNEDTIVSSAAVTLHATWPV